MSGDVHVRFCERRGVKFPPATHQIVEHHRVTDELALRQQLGVITA